MKIEKNEKVIAHVLTSEKRIEIGKRVANNGSKIMLVNAMKLQGICKHVCLFLFIIL